VSLLVLNIYHSSSFTKEVLEEAIDKKANKPKHNIIKFFSLDTPAGISIVNLKIIN